MQGVGFRPFVHRLASELGLAGSVGNDSGAVILEVQGNAAGCGIRSPAACRGPAAGPDQHRLRDRPGARRSGGTDFRIVASRDRRGGHTDSAGHRGVRPMCGRAVRPGQPPLPASVRHLHQLRSTIHHHRGLPYDRPATTMSAFAMCERCAAEYPDPADRRFHAQPIGCPDCGPTLRYRSRRAGARNRCRTRHPTGAGSGCGGRHQGNWRIPPCLRGRRGGDRGALRARKRRGAKPFAVMVRDLDVARAMRHRRHRGRGAVDTARPIVLLRRRRRCSRRRGGGTRQPPARTHAALLPHSSPVAGGRAAPLDRCPMRW